MGTQKNAGFTCTTDCAMAVLIVRVRLCCVSTVRLHVKMSYFTCGIAVNSLFSPGVKQRSDWQVSGASFLAAEILCKKT